MKNKCPRCLQRIREDDKDVIRYKRRLWHFACWERSWTRGRPYGPKNS